MSKKLTVLVINVDEGREKLVEWYADFLVNDRRNLLDMLRTGSMKELPNFSQKSEKEVADMLTSLPVGNKMASDAGVDVVLLQCDNTFLKVGEMELVDLVDVSPEQTTVLEPVLEVSF